MNQSAIKAAQVKAAEQAVCAGLERKGFTKAATKPQAIAVGEITFIDSDGEESSGSLRMLIEFPTAQAIRDALDTGHVDFSFLE